MLASSSIAEDLDRRPWPPKFDVLGIGVSATTYEEAIDLIVEAARRRQSAVCSHFAVHSVVSAAQDPILRKGVSTFDIVAPDGQPVRWALNRLHNAELTDRMYGPEMMRRLCGRAADEGISIYLYGSTPEVLAQLSANLQSWFPRLRIAGTESPPFRALTSDEEQAMIERINDSGAGIVFIGLGCPKQDYFAARYRDRLNAVQMCVGAAFDFHAGTKRTAPAWMQRRGLEWLFRLSQEPGRLWKRYFVTNSVFIGKFSTQYLRHKYRRTPDHLQNSAERAPKPK
jgi:N-acetylglucosaminyldiphosphoundecaprenol N-acetyl-beta-D-mannosaminyltransferase